MQADAIQNSAEQIHSKATQTEIVSVEERNVLASMVHEEEKLYNEKSAIEDELETVKKRLDGYCDFESEYRKYIEDILRQKQPLLGEEVILTAELELAQQSLTGADANDPDRKEKLQPKPNETVGDPYSSSALNSSAK